MTIRHTRAEQSFPPVLVVEGQAFPRRTLKRVLRALGVGTLLEARDAAAAMTALERAQCRNLMVFCDIEIAAENDLAFLRNLAGRLPWVRVAVLGARRADERAAFAQAVTDRGLEVLAVLPKPPSAEELRTLLMRASAPPPPSPQQARRRLTPDEVAQCLKADGLHAYFQPKIELVTGRTVGCEALARIVHPDYGVLLPARFMEAIDAVDGQRTLTAHMLESAGKLARALRAGGLSMTISVNVSPDCLSEPGDGAKLASYSSALGLRPAELVIELPQSALQAVPPAVAENLARLKALGYALSIDDFGSSGTGLDGLLGASYAELKLDRPIVARLAQEPDAQVAAAVANARKAGLVVCAEGIETPAELDAMRRIGVNFGQGFLFAEPMPAAALVSWVRQGGIRHRSRPVDTLASA